MRVMRVLALVLMAVSALSFGLTIYNIQATKWNIGRGTWDGGWGNGNWWEGTWDFDIFGGEHYNWFFGYYYQSLSVVVNHPLWENLLATGYYNPFPSAILGLYLLVCGIVLWFVKEENQRPSWFFNIDFGNNELVADAVTLVGVGAFSRLYGLTYSLIL